MIQDTIRINIRYCLGSLYYRVSTIKLFKQDYFDDDRPCTLFNGGGSCDDDIVGFWPKVKQDHDSQGYYVPPESGGNQGRKKEVDKVDKVDGGGGGIFKNL